MTLNLDHLKQIAQAATQGAWSADGPANPAPDDNLTVGPDTGEGVIAYVQPSWDDATHIAAFAPRTVLTLIAWLEKAEDTLQRVRDARSNHPEIPECDRYTGDDTIKCGWKSAVESIDKALEGESNE